MNHLQPTAMAGVQGVAGAVVQAVREQREKERREVQSVWERRLDKTYADAESAYAEARSHGADGIDAAAKFLMVQARLCDTGLRVDGVLAGGADNRITVNVEQLVVLPNPQPKSLPAIDIAPAEPTE